MLVKSVNVSMYETIGGSRKTLILLMLLVSILSQKASAQCDAVFSYTIDSVRGSIQLQNQSVKANPDSVLYSTWKDASQNVLSYSTHPILITGEGSFDICLYIENAGCTDSSCQLIVVPPAYCKADFTFTVDLTGKADFVSQSIGLQTNHFWSFGDGSYAHDSVTSHTFTTNGWYYVCLNTFNIDSSCKDVHCEFVRVNKPSPEPCDPLFDYTYDSANTKLVHFTNYTTGDTGITYLWLFGGDVTSTQKNPSYLFDSLGNYRVCLLVSGPNCADSICKTIEILQILPFCEANYTTRLFSDSANQTGRIAVFNNQSVGENLSYLWSFGDDSTSTLKNPIHYYPQNGLYKVCLTVANGNLCSDSQCIFIDVSPVNGLQSTESFAKLTVYPVPVNHTLHVEWQSYRLEWCLITLTDLQGRTLDTQTIQTQEGHVVYRLNTESFAPGLYTLTLQTQTGKKNIKVVK